MILRGLVFIGIFLLSGRPVAALDVAGYNHQLDCYAASTDICIRQARMQPASAAQAIDQFAESVPPTIQVSQRDQATVNVDLTWLSSGLRSAAHSRGQARVMRLRSLLARVHAQRDAAGLLPHIGPSSAIESRAALMKELSRREYRPSINEEFWQRFFGAIARALGKVNMPAGVADTIGLILLILIGILLLGLLAWLVWRLVEWASSRSPERGPRGPRVEAPVAVISQRSVLEAAERDAAAGRYREAFRGLYLAAILALDKASLIKYADGVTNREYLRALTRQDVADATAAFKPMTESFDRLVYGKRQISKLEYDECRERYDALERVI